MEHIKKMCSQGKCNFQFTTAEREYLERECGFTDEELEIFRLRARGKSVLQVSFIMEELHAKELPDGVYSTRMVERKIKHIKEKILRVLEQV